MPDKYLAPKSKLNPAKSRLMVGPVPILDSRQFNLTFPRPISSSSPNGVALPIPYAFVTGAGPSSSISSSKKTFFCEKFSDWPEMT